MDKRGIAAQDLEQDDRKAECMENWLVYHCILRLPAHQLDPWNRYINEDCLLDNSYLAT